MPLLNFYAVVSSIQEYFEFKIVDQRQMLPWKGTLIIFENIVMKNINKFAVFIDGSFICTF